MWLIEKEGRDPQRLMEEICQELGKTPHELEFQIEEKEGVLGVFGKKVVVKARPKAPREWELLILAEDLAQTLLSYLDPSLRAKAQSGKNAIIVHIEGGDFRGLKQRRNLLESIRLLIELAVSKRARAKRPVRLKLPPRENVSRETSPSP